MDVVHASCVVLGESGVLIRGASGSGKSTLARRLLLDRQRDGRFARLVADDRVRLSARHGRLLAEPVPPIAGLLEVRGVGLAPVPFEPCCVVGLVVDLGGPGIARMPERSETTVDLSGITMPRVAFASGHAAAGWIRWPLRG